MNPFPGDWSVLLLDNCQIHKSEQLQKAFENKSMFFVHLDLHFSWGNRLCAAVPPTIFS